MLPRTLAKLAAYLGREFRACRTGHLLQGLGDFAVGEHIQERRLPQGDGERRLQCVIEHWITCVVGKIGDNDGVLFGQAVCALARTEVERSRDYNRDKYDGGGNTDLPEFPARYRNFGHFRCAQ